MDEFLNIYWSTKLCTRGHHHSSTHSYTISKSFFKCSFLIQLWIADRALLNLFLAVCILTNGLPLRLNAKRYSNPRKVNTLLLRVSNRENLIIRVFSWDSSSLNFLIRLASAVYTRIASCRYWKQHTKSSANLIIIASPRHLGLTTLSNHKSSA